MKMIQTFCFCFIGIILLTANANAGRWISRDPVAFMERDPKPALPGSSASQMPPNDIQLQVNLYAYVENNPVNEIDPLGLWNLWSPMTYGVPTGAGTTIWNSLNPFDASTGYSLLAASQSDAAFLDGVNPFGNPFANMGLYDPCDSWNKWSKSVGGWTRDAELTLAPGGLLHYAGDLPVIGDESYLFGKGSGLLNNNDLLRIGWGGKSDVGQVFRAVVGGNRTSAGQFISDTIPASLRHFDFYY